MLHFKRQQPESELGKTLQEQIEDLSERVRSLEEAMQTKTIAPEPIKKQKIKDSLNRFKTMIALYEYLTELGYPSARGYFKGIDFDSNHVEMNYNQIGQYSGAGEESVKRISERCVKMLSTVFGGQWTYSVVNRKGE